MDTLSLKGLEDVKADSPMRLWVVGSRAKRTKPEKPMAVISRWWGSSGMDKHPLECRD
jgi:hypothetical protein